MIFGTEARRKTIATRRLADHSTTSQRVEDRCLIRWEVRPPSRLESRPQRGGFFAIPVPGEKAPIARRRRMSFPNNRRAAPVQAAARQRARKRLRCGSHLETTRRPADARNRNPPANAHRGQEPHQREPSPALAQVKRHQNQQAGPVRWAMANGHQTKEPEGGRQVEPRCRAKAQK